MADLRITSSAVVLAFCAALLAPAAIATEEGVTPNPTPPRPYLGDARVDLADTAEKLKAAADAVPIQRPTTFHPDAVDPKTIRYAIVNEELSADFAGINTTLFRRPPIMPLSRYVHPLTGRSVSSRSSPANPPAICKKEKCAPPPEFRVTASLATPDSYRLTLTVRAGGASGTWSVTRPFNALNLNGLHPIGAESDWSIIMRSIGYDLDLFGREACAAIVRDTCPGGVGR